MQGFKVQFTVQSFIFTFPYSLSYAPLYLEMHVLWFGKNFKILLFKNIQWFAMKILKIVYSAESVHMISFFVDHKDQIPVGKTEKNGKKTGHS